MSDIYKFKTLLGHNNLDFSITCLRSFIENAEQEIHLQIFEDGSLTCDDKKHLTSALPKSVIVDKNLREKTVVKKLSDHPKCFYYRNTSNYAQKLFDLALFDDEDIFYIDSDIFFIKKFILPKFDQVPTFMEDTHNAYSFQPVDFWQLKYPIFPYVNSGLFFFPRKWYDLDYIEKLLNDVIIYKGVTKKISWLEQTLWAYLATKTGKLNYFDDQQIVMAQQILKPTVSNNINKEVIAVHLVFTLRGPGFNALTTLPSLITNRNTYQQIKFKPAKSNLNRVQLTSEWLRKKWHMLTAKGWYNKSIFLTRKQA